VITPLLVKAINKTGGAGLRALSYGFELWNFNICCSFSISFPSSRLGTPVSAKAWLGQFLSYADGLIQFIMLPNGALQENGVTNQELGNQSFMFQWYTKTHEIQFRSLKFPLP
jgi:hypothetical protein